MGLQTIQQFNNQLTCSSTIFKRIHGNIRVESSQNFCQNDITANLQFFTRFLPVNDDFQDAAVD